LVAVLRVVRYWPSHQEAAEWYRQGHLALPRNCMVRDKVSEQMYCGLESIPCKSVEKEENQKNVPD
jgi:hypothetical protein